MSFRTIVSCASMSFAFALAGCGSSSSTATDHSVPSLHGRMMGGQQPVSGATIQLYTVGKSKDGSTSTPMITGTTVTTGADGGFTITGDYSCATSNATDVYITASGGDPLPGTPNVSLTLMAALGQCSSLASIAYININELTTVAAVAALHPYMSSITAIGSAGGDASALDSAFTVAAELVNIATGSSPGPNIPPGEMVPSTLINTFGDVVAPCINSASGAGNTPSSPCARLFTLATPPGGVAPTETVGALLDIENNPTHNATELWDQIGGIGVQFLPDLGAAPSSWAIALIPETLGLAAATPVAIARQDGTPGSDALTLTRSAAATGAVTITASGLPAGLSAAFTQFDYGNAGSVTFSTPRTPAAAGNYTVTLSATDGIVTATTTVVVTVAVVITVTASTDTSSGFSGHLQQFMSTNVLPNPRSDSFFYAHPSTKAIAALQPLHIRIQPNTFVTPWVTMSTPAVATDWNFQALDDTAQLMLSVGDDSPAFQIAEVPSFMNGSNGYFDMANLAEFVLYAQNLVRYYNTGGFDYAGEHFQSASSQHITWWEIFNEPNIQGISPANYVKMYDAVVPAMLAVDPTLKFIAVSLSDFSNEPELFLPTLVQPSGAGGGLSAQVDAVSTHFYGTCHQYATDASLFTGIADFVSDINYFHTEFAKRSDLADVPVWVNENDVNSEGCTPRTPDSRATSVFFTAYRPLTFVQFGKAASKSLYHFSFEGNSSFGEVLTTNSKAPTTIAYWTDYWLQRTFPWDGTSAGSTIYVTTTTEPSPTVEALAVRNADGSVSLMVTDYAVANVADDNGGGAPRLIYVDLGALGSFSTATEVDLNASTSSATGPAVYAIIPASDGMLPLMMSGYGSSMFVLKP